MAKQSLVRRRVTESNPEEVTSMMVQVALNKEALATDDLYQTYRAKLAIDQNDLDTCIQQQAMMFLTVQEEYSMAVSRRDGARDTLSRTDAELARDIRADFAKQNTKATESLINDTVMLAPWHIKASSILSDAKQKADQWGGLVAAYEQRLRMLRELVALYSAGYWSSRSVEGSGVAVRDALAASAREKIEEKRNARKGV